MDVKKLVRYLVLIAIVVFSTSVMAQTVTVDAANPSPDNVTTFNSLQMAIHSFQASGDTTAASPGGVGVNHGDSAPDVINIVSTAVIDESIVADAEGSLGNGQVVLDEDLTIQGYGVTAIVALQMNSSAASPFNDCGFCWRQSTNLTLKNIIFIPSLTNTPTDDGVYFRQPTSAVNPVINIENVVITSNNGSNAPVTTTGLDNPDLTGATGFGDDALYVVSRTEGGSITMNATDLVISSYNTEDGGNHDGIIMFMSGTTNDIVNCFVNLGPGCVISNCNRFGIQNPYGGYLNIQGSKEKPVIINNVGADGIWNYSDTTAPTQATICEVNHCIVNNCGGSGIKEQETAGRGFIKSIKNTIISNCEGPGIALFAFGALPPIGGVTDTVEITSVTVHNCGYNDGNSPPWSYGIAAPVYSATYKTNRNAVITNAIISGSGMTGIYNDGDGTFSVDYSALVTESLGGYGYALAATTGGSGTINVGANVINDNPIYVAYGVNDFASADFMDVDNPAFAGKGSGGIDLAGGADYIGSWTPPLAVGNTWLLYE